MRGFLVVLVVGMLAMVGLVAGAAAALSGSEERLGLADGPAARAPLERPEAELEAVARGCAAAGHEVLAGVHQGVWLVKCVPVARRPTLEGLGVVPVAEARR
jgi:hypothetical protein